MAVQTYNMGNKTEMLVAVRAPEGKKGPIQVTLTTDLPTDAFLHWGVKRGGGSDWLAPLQDMWPAESAVAEANAAAVDTPFLESNDPDTQNITVRASQRTYQCLNMCGTWGDMIRQTLQASTLQELVAGHMPFMLLQVLSAMAPC